MLDIQQLRTDLETVVASLARRGFAFDTLGFTALEAERKEVRPEHRNYRLNVTLVLNK